MKATSRPRSLWFIVLANATFSVTIGALLVNSMLLSELIWPGEPFHAMEMGAIITIMTWTSAASGLVVGRVADKHSRKAQLSFAMALIGVSFAIKALIPMGLGLWTFLAFVPCYVIDGWGSGSIMPVLLSYTNDALPADARSQFFGVFFGMDQVAMISGMLFGAVMFEIGLWWAFFGIIGVVALADAAVIAWKLPEPKRGVQHKELREVLQNEKVQYQYALNAQTLKSTFFRPTNVIAFIEGIFTCVLIAATNFLIFPYLQSPPHNLGASTAALFVVIFGMPGTLFGTAAFSRLSDKLGKRDIRNRLSLIAFSVAWMAIGELLLFLLPAPRLQPSQGGDLGLVFGMPAIWGLGLVLFFLQATNSIYMVNQSPVIQVINLPEAQATITAWNQFLQTIGLGIAPIIAGAVLAATSGNYVLAAVTCVTFGIPGGILWAYGRKKIHADIAHIDSILRGRASVLKQS